MKVFSSHSLGEVIFLHTFVLYPVRICQGAPSEPKAGMKCVVCALALPGASGRWCTKCLKVKYCSKQCQAQHTAAHHPVCAVVQDLKMHLSGFNDRLFLKHGPEDAALLPSPVTYRKLFTLGQQQLAAGARGALCYTTHRREKLEEVRQRHTAGELFVDPYHPALVIHAFFTPVAELKPWLALLSVKSRRHFRQLCQLTTSDGVPMLYFREVWSEGEPNWRVSVFWVAETEF